MSSESMSTSLVTDLDDSGPFGLPIFPPDIQIDEVREAIAGSSEFKEVHSKDYVAFTYIMLSDATFPNPYEAPDARTARLWQIRRECRGIVFHRDTLAILARRYHKFFNVNEMPESKSHLIDLNDSFVVLEKLDGSMVSPFYTNESLRFGSKHGAGTDVGLAAEAFVASSGHIPYAEFSAEWIDRGYTPIFEFCGPEHRIVLQYHKDFMHLTALRNMSTGRYVPYGEMRSIADAAGIPVVCTVEGEIEGRHASDVEQFDALITDIRSRTGLEGYVVRFDGGKMYKVKTLWYFEFGKRLDLIRNPNEKHLWRFILSNEYDDVRPYLSPSDRSKMDRFANDLVEVIQRSSERMSATVKKCAGDLTRKEFATWVRTQPDALSAVYWKMYKGEHPMESLKEYVLARCLSTINTLNRIRPFLEDISYSTYEGTAS